MRRPSIRTLAAIAYERGEEFDPALMLSPTLAEQLDSSTTVGATAIACDPSDMRRARRESCIGLKSDRRESDHRESDHRESDRHEASRGGVSAQAVPSWLEAGDLVPGPLDTRHGELLAELIC
jgi:hypothetical protein